MNSDGSGQIRRKIARPPREVWATLAARMSLAEIADLLDVKYKTASRWGIQFGIRPLDVGHANPRPRLALVLALVGRPDAPVYRGKRPPDDRLAELAAEHTAAEIAEICGVSYWSAWQWLKAAGLQARSGRPEPRKRAVRPPPEVEVEPAPPEVVLGEPPQELFPDPAPIEVQLDEPDPEIERPSPAPAFSLAEPLDEIPPRLCYLVQGGLPDAWAAPHVAAGRGVDA